MLVLAGVIAGTGLMYMTTQRQLAPEEDQGILFTLVKTPQYANLDYLEDATDQLYGASALFRRRSTSSPSTAWATCNRPFPDFC